VIPELQDLLGASTFSQLAREELGSAPTISFDENELTVQIFESSSPTNISEGVEITSRLENPTPAGKISPVTMEKRPVEYPNSAIRSSRHLPYVKGMVDATRHRSLFKTIRNSEVWATLVQSCANFVDTQVAEAAR